MAVEGGVAIFVDEDAIKAGVGPTFMPVVNGAVLLVIVSPQITGGGFTFSRIETFDRGLIDPDVVALPDAIDKDFVKWSEPLGKVIMPAAHDIAGEYDLMTGTQLPFLTVKGTVVAKLLREQIGS